MLGKLSTDGFEFLNQLHLWPFVLASVVIGLLGSIAMMLVSVFRLLGEVSDSYYEFRLRCLRSKNRFRAIRDQESSLSDSSLPDP